MVQSINYKRDLQRIERIVGKAKAAAWGPKMIPVNGKRKVRSLLPFPHGHSLKFLFDLLLGQSQLGRCP